MKKEKIGNEIMEILLDNSQNDLEFFNNLLFVLNLISTTLTKFEIKK